jgi:histidine triad (HIT) family protein
MTEQKNCIFCKIINREIESNIVVENGYLIAIMDIRQALPGHVLVIPKDHVDYIYDLKHDTGSEIMKCLIELSKSVKDAFQVEGLNIWQSNGKCAGQEVMHLHFHIHPRKSGDNLLKFYPSSPAFPANAELQKYAEKIRTAYSGKNG